MGFAVTPAAAAAASAGVAAPLQAAWDRHFPPSASTLHPVFFTERLRRAPAVLPPGRGMAGGGSSPVAHGYVYQAADGSKGPKL